MAKFRGSQGSATIGGNAVGEIQAWELTPERAYIDGGKMGDAAQTGGDLDIPSGRGRIRVKFDYGDTAQAAMFDQVVSNATPTPLAFVGIVESGGPKQISCNILITSVPINGQFRGGHFEATYEFVTDSAITVSWT